VAVQQQHVDERTRALGVAVGGAGLLDHYLEVLVRKPGALPGATALAQARASGVFTGEHQRFWDRLLLPGCCSSSRRVWSQFRLRRYGGSRPLYCSAAVSGR
jgi:hypothetical protein